MRLIVLETIVGMSIEMKHTNAASQAQITALCAGLQPYMNRRERLDFLSKLVGRSISSSKELTSGEATGILTALFPGANNHNWAIVQGFDQALLEFRLQ